nr:thioredoxin-disulfide reductase [Clostridia bacterium]
MAAKQINEQQLHELISSGKTLLVDFWAPWCGDCRRIEAAYDQIADEYADVLTAVKINVDDFAGIRQREEIRRIPTLRLYRDGQALGQMIEPPARADIDAFLADFLPREEKAQPADIPLHDMVIIGGGPGGYTAALYAARAGLNVLVAERMGAGGQMALTHQIDNYPGFADGVDGFELAQQMQRQAERFGVKTLSADVRRVDLTASPKVIETSEGILHARTVILATGANPRPLGLPEEKDLLGRGVAYCAACDGMFYKGKTVAVVGGGNTAAADALLLSRIAEKVILIHRRDSLRATKVYHEPLQNAANVEFRWNSVVTELQHDGLLTGVRLRDVHTGEETDVACDAVFVSIGRKPASGLAEGQLAMEDGYILADETTRTSLPGVYAVGDVRTKLLRQVVTAVADGAMAAHMAEEYLAGQA